MSRKAAAPDRCNSRTASEVVKCCVQARVDQLALGQSDRATKADRDEIGPQRMCHRLAHPEVDGEGEGGNHLCETQAITRSCCHNAIVRRTVEPSERATDAVASLRRSNR
jgi:hypothetical protein